MRLNETTFIISSRHPPSSLLFPYTTLFRSITALLPARTAADCPVPGRGDGSRAPDGRRPRSLRTGSAGNGRSEEHTSELQSRGHLVCRLLIEKKKDNYYILSTKKQPKYR